VSNLKLDIGYNSQGILLSVVGGKSDTFPLNQYLAGQIGEDWLKLNAAEQLWYDGLLQFDENERAYILSPEAYYQLDDESKVLLSFPPEDANIAVQEQNNIGNRNYDIHWYPKVGSRTVGRTKRYGNVIEYGDTKKCLTEEQYRLVEAIEHHDNLADVNSRGRFHAEVSKLAEKANADMSSFMQKREFIFADEADYVLASDSDQELHFEPILLELDDDILQKMPDRLGNVIKVQHGAKRATVFTSKNAQEDYNRIASLPRLTGAQVPEFLDNPYAYLPEDYELDLAEFSERVKGLKIRKSSAVPYIRVEKDTQKNGWYDIEAGYHFNLDSNTSDDNELVYTDELKQAMLFAAGQGQKYLYYQDQWIKINPEDIAKFHDVESKINNEFSNRIPIENLRYILDIYDNLNEIEYNEELQRHREIGADGIKLYASPQSFVGNLLEHQLSGYSFLRANYDNKIGVLLADDMGLGKTVQIIAFLSHLYDVNELATTLLVMPKSLLENWKAELNKFLPVEKNIYIHQGAQRYKSHEIIKQYDVVLTTYETLARDQTMLGRIPWTCVICDEVQKIKNFLTTAANAVKGMNTQYRIAMTGTPVENRLSELWSIVDFVQPGLLDGYKVFKKTYETPIASNAADKDRLIDKLVETLSPIFIRRTKEDVLADKLPVKQEITVPIEMDNSSENFYRMIISEIGSDKQMVLATITKLLMLCSHPKLVAGGDISESVDDLIKASPKLFWTIQKLEEIFKQGEKVLIFTKYTKMQSILRQVIYEKFGLDAKIINGDVTGNRSGMVDEFSKIQGAGVLILSPKAAGVGLTITAANHVIHYTREWNPAAENQATDRAYRIGQTKPVTVYYPIIRTSNFVTVEERLDELLMSKRELMKSVIVPANLEIKIEEFADVLHV